MGDMRGGVVVIIVVVIKPRGGSRIPGNVSAVGSLLKVVEPTTHLLAELFIAVHPLSGMYSPSNPPPVTGFISV